MRRIRKVIDKKREWIGMAIKKITESLRAIYGTKGKTIKDKIHSAH